MTYWQYFFAKKRVLGNLAFTAITLFFGIMPIYYMMADRYTNGLLGVSIVGLVVLSLNFLLNHRTWKKL